MLYDTDGKKFDNFFFIIYTFKIWMTFKKRNVHKNAYN